MYQAQAINNPFGVSVFGSAIIRVEPDIASVHISVSRLKKQPKDALRETHGGARTVSEYLSNTGIDEINSSRITLKQSFKYENGVQVFQGYEAEISFHILVSKLNLVEDLLIGVVDAGANNIKLIDMQTSKLKEYRTEARTQAIAAAYEKAEIYCNAAGVKVGKVIHIEDANPDQLRGGEGHSQHAIKGDNESTINVFDPGSIIVGAAVRVAYEFGG